MSRNPSLVSNKDDQNAEAVNLSLVVTGELVGQ